MIIDAHNHPDWHGHNFDAVLANMNQYNIAATWLLSCEMPEGEYAPSYLRVFSPAGGSAIAIPFERCLSYAERAKERFVLGYAPDPRIPGAIDRLEAAIAIHNVKVCGEFKYRIMCDNPDALKMFRFCGEKGLPVIVHIGVEETPQYDVPSTGNRYSRPHWWYAGGIDAFERAVKACPETTFLGHASGFWSNISADARYEEDFFPGGTVIPGGKVVTMLRQYPNLYCDISAFSGLNALQRDGAFAKEFLMEFQDRILYARDQFDNAHQDFLNSLDLPQEVIKKLYYKNSQMLIELKTN